MFYVYLDLGYEGRELFGLFSSRERAEQALVDAGNELAHFSVEEIEVDVPYKGFCQ